MSDYSGLPRADAADGQGRPGLARVAFGAALVIGALVVLVLLLLLDLGPVF